MSHRALSLIAEEARLLPGAVPEHLAGTAVAPGHYRLSSNEFLLRAEGFAVHYRKGDGVRYQLDDEKARRDMELVLSGSVRAAVACINGFYPLHASAVVIDEQVIAFTGSSGSGKSTLVAALNKKATPLFCDDTLVLDLDQSPPLCLPGYKRLKLWPDALELAGVQALDLVSDSYRKYYCSFSGGDRAVPLPLGCIVSLAQGKQMAFERLRGGQRIAALADDHYTAAIHQAARGYAPRERLAWLARVAGSVPIYRFTRPFARESFAASTDFILEALNRREPS